MALGPGMARNLARGVKKMVSVIWHLPPNKITSAPWFCIWTVRVFVLIRNCVWGEIKLPEPKYFNFQNFPAGYHKKKMNLFLRELIFKQNYYVLLYSYVIFFDATGTLALL